MVGVVLALALQVPLHTAKAADVRRLDVSQPRVVIQLANVELQGLPTRLAWSPGVPVNWPEWIMAPYSW